MLAIVAENIPSIITWPDIMRSLYGAGYTVTAGVLHDPAGTPVLALPDDEPTTALTLPCGRVLPVVDVAATPTATQVVSGYDLVVVGDTVERRWQVVDVPQPVPVPLATLQAQAVAVVRAASEQMRAAYYPTGKEFDIRRGAPGYTAADVVALNRFVDGTLRMVAGQAVIEIEAADSPESLSEIMVDYRALYGQGAA